VSREQESLSKRDEVYCTAALPAPGFSHGFFLSDFHIYFEPEAVKVMSPTVSVPSFNLLCSEFPTHGRDAGFKTESLNNFFQHR